MNALYLRFAGPLQSWAGPRITGNHVHTALQPTRSGTLGVLAAALGAAQNDWPEWIHDIGLHTRIDNPGQVQRDYQTINPRGENQKFAERIWTASGRKGKAPTSFTPDAQKGTSIVLRTYLSGAEFLVRVTHPERLEQIATACAHPEFSPFLGRKAFAPSFPFLLGTGEADLLTRAPAAATIGTVSVEGAAVLPIHHLVGQHDDSPRESAQVDCAPFTERMQWWKDQARIPDRLSSS